tara:strand:- start:10658 stop:11155 length:498 start_codon:yes stop_codon:yes gene_type:complete
MGILTKRVRKQRNSTRKNKLKGGGCGVSGGKGKNKSKGGCGCSIGGKRKNKKSKTNKRKVKGGSQHLETLPLRYYYPLNDHSSSLSDSYGISSTTDKFAGGKKTRKQMKGGGMMDNFLDGSQTNASTNFGAKTLYELQTIDHIQNASVLEQPAGNIRNDHSPLMV